MDNVSIISAAATVFAAANIAAGMAVLNGLFTAVGQGNIAAKAIESIARQPEARGSVTGSMIVGMGMSETSGIYGLVVAILLMFVNPISTAFVNFVTPFMTG